MWPTTYNNICKNMKNTKNYKNYISNSKSASEITRETYRRNLFTTIFWLFRKKCFLHMYLFSVYEKMMIRSLCFWIFNRKRISRDQSSKKRVPITIAILQLQKSVQLSATHIIAWWFKLTSIYWKSYVVCSRILDIAWKATHMWSMFALES